VTTNSFGYNGLDARVSKTDSTGTYGFKRNGAGVTDPVLSDGAATYTPGISERRGGNSKFLHSGMKNADAQSGASANVDSSRTYDAFGNLTGSSGTWSGPFGYAGGFGYQEDPDHGLRLLGHRYYDSSTGRFISKDPIGDGRNWYGYCGNNPVVASDPTGLLAWFPIIAGALTVLDIIELVQDVKEIADDPTNPSAYIDPLLGVIDPTPFNMGRRTIRTAARVLDTPVAATAAEPTRNQLKRIGRSGKQAKLRELGKDDKAPSHVRGWIKQEQNSIKRGNRTRIRVPPNKQLAHRRGKAARDGYSYKHSDLQDYDLHKTQHRMEGRMRRRL
jgi:RHS repeat-associated protein